LKKFLQIACVGATLFLVPTKIKTQWNNYLPCDGQIAWAELSASQPAANLIPSGSFTVEGWLYFNQAEAPGCLLSLRNENNVPIYRLGKEAGRSFYFEVSDANGKIWRVLANEETPTGEWIHLAGVFQEQSRDLDQLAIYLNGVRRGVLRENIELARRQAIENQHPTFKLSGEGENETFSGRLDEVRISSCPRYLTHVISSLDDTFSADSATIALWHFDEPFGSASLVDASVHGFDLSLARSTTSWPVTLDDLNVAEFGKGSLLLTWKTNNETELEGFEVQRRNALDNFESIGYLPAHGVGKKEFSYDFSDMPEASGRYYYRLKLLSCPGHFRFSPEVGIDFAALSN
jgi:hypothetical protein